MRIVNGNIFNIQRFSVHDGPGARTTVFFKGCNLHCIWCHNPESITMHPVVEFYPHKCIGDGACLSVCENGAQLLTKEGVHVIDRDKCIHCLKCTDTCYAGALAPVGQTVTTEYVMKQILSDKPYYDQSGGGVTFSGGEAMLQIDFLTELVKQCKSEGIHTAIDTAGNVPTEWFDRVIDAGADMYLYDMKAAGSEVHKALTGSGNERIIANLKYLSERGQRIFVRIPFIQSRNGSEINGMADILKDIKPEIIEVLPYHRLGAAKYSALDLPDLCRDEAVPDEEVVDAAVDILKAAGLNARKS